MTARGASALLIFCVAGTISSRAGACSYIQPSFEETAQHIASVGFVIHGTVTQNIDLITHRELIIRSEKVFVGDIKPQLFVMYYSQREYEILRDPRSAITSCDHPARNYSVGYEGIFILEPAVSAVGDQTANGRWVESIFGRTLLGQRSWPLLKEAATRTGRFRAAPPLLQ